MCAAGSSYQTKVDKEVPVTLQFNNIPRPAIIKSKSAVLSSEAQFENSVQSTPSTGEFQLSTLQYSISSVLLIVLHWPNRDKWLLIHLCRIKNFPVLSRSSCESSCMNTSIICFVKCCGLVNFKIIIVKKKKKNSPSHLHFFLFKKKKMQFE